MQSITDTGAQLAKGLKGGGSLCAGKGISKDLSLQTNCMPNFPAKYFTWSQTTSCFSEVSLFYFLESLILQVLYACLSMHHHLYNRPLPLSLGPWRRQHFLTLLKGN